MNLISIRLVVLTNALLLLGCSHNPEFRDYAKPKTGSNNASEFQEQQTGRYRASAPVQAWWKHLRDTELTNLVTLSLQHNFDVRIALANIAAARSVVDETKLDRLPTVRANASAARQRLSDEGINGANADRTLSNYDVGFDASWELDLFGRVESGIDFSLATLEARQADADAVYVTVAAEVARIYVELRGAQLQLSVARENAKNQHMTLELTENLVAAGRGSRLDLERAKSQLLLTESQIPPWQATVNSTINRLGVLTGQTPDALRTQLKQIKPLPSLPESISVGDNASLLARRPDVRAAEREFAASVANYNINVAELYPRLTLQGSIGFLATSFSSIFTGGASNSIFGPNISWAAFDLGRVNARIKASDANAKANLARFEKTVLVALEEVDTSMVNFSREEQRRAKLASAFNSSAKASQLARQRYDAGRDTFLDLLDAERTLLEAQSRLANSETNVLLNLIAVYKALGGGWQMMVDD